MQVFSYTPLDDARSLVSVWCNLCRHEFKFEASTAGLERYQAGALIQVALPEIPKAQRELLISGTCDECFHKLFPGGEGMMFGDKLLEGLFGKESEISTTYAFMLGQRLGKRCHYGATTLKVMQWIAAEDWKTMSEWLLKDLPNEQPLPPQRYDGPLPVPSRRRRKK